VWVYLDGAWLDEHAAAIPIDDRGFLYADAVYETARLHRGGYFRLRQHLDRLVASAATLRIPLPPIDDIVQVAAGLAHRNDLSEGTFRITVSRGSHGADPGTVLATLRPLPDDLLERAERGWSIITAAVRRPSIAAIPAHLKSPGRPYAILARLEAEARGADDALLLDERGHVSEGPTWNVFWRRGDTLATPSVECGVLPGVTRAAIMGLARAAGLRPAEGRYSRADLDDADEIFATMSSAGVVAFRSLDGRDLPPSHTAAAGLQRSYWELVARETTA
jgi:branched-chain amino acid aminotransferase